MAEIYETFLKALELFNVTIEQPELDRIAKEHLEGKFDEAEGRNVDLREHIEGPASLEGVPQDIIDQARANGGSIIKRQNGTFYVTGTGQGNFQPGSTNLGKPGTGPTIGEIAKTGIEDFGEIRENVMGRFDDLSNTIIPGFEQRKEDVLGRFGDVSSGLSAQATGRTETGMALINRLMGEMQGGFGELRGDLLGTLEGAGAQERIDINETFDNLGDATQAGLISSGLSGTTILPSLQADVARQRTGAQGRLDERLRQQELGVIGSTGFGALASQQDLGTFGAGMFGELSGDALRLSTILGGLGIDLEAGLEADVLGATRGMGEFGIALDASTGADLANAGIQLNQIPFGWDFNLTAQENALTLAQGMQPGYGMAGQVAQLGRSWIPPDTPDQPNDFETYFPTLFGGLTNVVTAGIGAGIGSS